MTGKLKKPLNITSKKTDKTKTQVIPAKAGSQLDPPVKLASPKLGEAKSEGGPEDDSFVLGENMARAFVTQELHFEAPNETGLLGRVVLSLAVQDVAIVHLCAYTAENKGFMQMITKDNAKAQKALTHFIPKIEERDVLVVEFENKVGTLAPVAKLLGSNGIHVAYVYGTSGDGFKITGVFSTSDNAKAADLINRS